MEITCTNQDEAIAISSLMQNCESVQIDRSVSVPRDIGRDGWAALSEALSWRLHNVPYLHTGLKSFMASAERKDLRAIWECLSLAWKISRSDGSYMMFSHHIPEAGWQRLEQFLDLTDRQWRDLYPALAPAMLFEEVEELVLAAILRVEKFRMGQQQPLGPEEVRALVLAVNQAVDALHLGLGTWAYQKIQQLNQQLGDSMQPLDAFEAALQAHGVVLAFSGGAYVGPVAGERSLLSKYGKQVNNYDCCRWASRCCSPMQGRQACGV